MKEELGWAGEGGGWCCMVLFCFFLEGASCTHARMHTHARTHLCPPNLFRLEKLYHLHLHKNN